MFCTVKYQWPGGHDWTREPAGLLEMDDFRFYRPLVRGGRESGSEWGDEMRKSRKESSTSVFNASAEDFEEEQALLLLAKHRK